MKHGRYFDMLLDHHAMWQKIVQCSGDVVCCFTHACIHAAV